MSELTHRMKCIAGRYKCEDCDYDTLNVACAKYHTAEENNLDDNVEVTDFI